jgi:hypothetical protein
MGGFVPLRFIFLDDSALPEIPVEKRLLRLRITGPL